MLHEDRPEKGHVVHTSLRYFHDLFSKIKLVVKYPAFQLGSVYILVANELLNQTTEVVGDIKGHYAEHRNSSTH